MSLAQVGTSEFARGGGTGRCIAQQQEASSLTIDVVNQIIEC